jgi:hypothetical protein
MRTSLLIVIAATAAFAQRPTAGGMGSVLFPGTGGPPRTPAGPTTGRGSVIAPGGNFRGGAPSLPVAHPQHHRAVIVPYPVYYGPATYAIPPAQYGPGVADAQYPPDQPPVLIMNQAYRPEVANPVIRDYTNVPLRESAPQAPADDTPSYYLIALKDHSIQTAIAYWVLDDTLSWISLQDEQKKIPLSEVDTDFTKQLNRERRIEFKLPSR